MDHLYLHRPLLNIGPIQLRIQSYIGKTPFKVAKNAAMIAKKAAYNSFKVIHSLNNSTTNIRFYEAWFNDLKLTFEYIGLREHKYCSLVYGFLIWNTDRRRQLVFDKIK